MGESASRHCELWLSIRNTILQIPVDMLRQGKGSHRQHAQDCLHNSEAPLTDVACHGFCSLHEFGFLILTKINYPFYKFKWYNVFCCTLYRRNYLFRQMQKTIFLLPSKSKKLHKHPSSRVCSHEEPKLWTNEP
jgi:hypothetical protein